MTTMAEGEHRKAVVSIAPFGSHILLTVDDAIRAPVTVLLEARALARLIIEGQMILAAQRNPNAADMEV